MERSENGHTKDSEKRGAVPFEVYFEGSCGHCEAEFILPNEVVLSLTRVVRECCGAHPPVGLSYNVHNNMFGVVREYEWHYMWCWYNGFRDCECLQSNEQGAKHLGYKPKRRGNPCINCAQRPRIDCFCVV